MSRITVTKAPGHPLAAHPVAFILAVAAFGLAWYGNVGLIIETALPLLGIKGAGAQALALWGPLIALVPAVKLWQWRAKAKVANAQRAAFQAVSRTRVEHASSNGIHAAIGLSEDTLLLIQDGRLAAIPLSAIRNAWWEVPGWNEVTVYGGGAEAFVAGQQASWANAAARYNAEKGSGLFVQVADASHPLWQFRTTDAAALRRWSERLTQAFEHAEAA